MLDLDRLDLEEIATALQDQDGCEHRWLINPQTGEIAFWTEDTGVDGHSPVDLDELDLVAIDPLPSYVWYEDMVDFAQQISDDRAGRDLARAIDGRGAFRRFRNELHQEYPRLLPAWYAFRDISRQAPRRSMAGRPLARRRRDRRPVPRRAPGPRAALNGQTIPIGAGDVRVRGASDSGRSCPSRGRFAVDTAARHA